MLLKPRNLGFELVPCRCVEASSVCQGSTQLPIKDVRSKAGTQRAREEMLEKNGKYTIIIFLSLRP